MLPVATALAYVLEIAGVVGAVAPYVDTILKITSKGENISQEELDELLLGLNARSEQIQSANPDRA